MEVNGIKIHETNPNEGSSTTTIAKDFDNFLTLLTTQLQNQDPLSPMDTTEFTNQLTQFAQVEQAINTNKKLDSLLDVFVQSQVSTGVSYIGKYAAVPGAELELVDGQARAGFDFEEAPVSATVAVVDAAGSVVRLEEIPATSGWQEFVWDGRDNSGTLMQDGTYRIQVSGLDEEEQPINVQTYTYGEVTAVHSEDGKVLVHVNGLAVPLGDLNAVTDSL